MKRNLLSFLILLASFSVSGQKDLSYFLPSAVSYSASIPEPASIIGHQPGEWHVTHDRLLGYMKLLDAVSERAMWETVSYTHLTLPTKRIV